MRRRILKHMHRCMPSDSKQFFLNALLMLVQFLFVVFFLLIRTISTYFNFYNLLSRAYSCYLICYRALLPLPLLLFLCVRALALPLPPPPTFGRLLSYTNTHYHGRRTSIVKLFVYILSPRVKSRTAYRSHIVCTRKDHSRESTKSERDLFCNV